MSIKFGLPAQENIYQVVSQSIEEKRNPVINRTINQKLRAYQYPMKADISLEFDYMKEEFFALLSADMRNGIDKERLFIPHPWDLCIYNFYNKSGATKGFYLESNDPAAAYAETNEFSADMYNKTKARDTDYYDFTPSQDYMNVFCRWDIDDYLLSVFSAKSIRRLTLLVIGKASEADYIVSIWNTKNSAWEDLGSSYEDQLAAGEYINGIFTRNLDNSFSYFSDYIYGLDSIVFRIRNYNTSGKTLRINYVALYVNGFNVIVEDPQIDFNFRDRYSGAGYRGTLKLLEV